MSNALSEFNRTWMRAYAEGIAEMYRARVASSDARLKVVRCRAELEIAQAELVEAEQAEELHRNLGNVIDEQMARIQTRAEDALRTPEEFSDAVSPSKAKAS